MAPPALSDFRDHHPRFALTPDGVVELALTQAEGRVGADWSPEDQLAGRMLWAAHTLTLGGHGAGAEADMIRSGAGGFRSMKSGTLTLERFGSDAGKTGFARTSYGQLLLELMGRYHSGPVVIGGSGWAPSHLAKDWPL